MEDKIEQDNPVRLIEAFVEYIEWEKLGIAAPAMQQEGRPGFDARLTGVCSLVKNTNDGKGRK